jgi:hypothetical protein
VSRTLLEHCATESEKDLASLEVGGWVGRGDCVGDRVTGSFVVGSGDKEAQVFGSHLAQLL